jgi:hypothetical protein
VPAGLLSAQLHWLGKLAAWLKVVYSGTVSLITTPVASTTIVLL